MTGSTTDVTITRIIPAEPRDVFEAWLAPKSLSSFMCPAEGTTVSKVEVEPRVGGTFLVVMCVGGHELPHRGEYLQIDRYTRLAFTWRSAVAGNDGRVTLCFESAPNGRTKLTLHHSKLNDESVRRRHESGWTRILSELSVLLIARAKNLSGYVGPVSG